jgi:hypothetical protein
MKSYRLLLIDERGRIAGSRAIECMSDREAVGIVKEEPGPYALIEIWRGGDPVCLYANPKRALAFRLTPSTTREYC